MKVGRKSDVVEAWEVESFKNEAVTMSVKKGLREEQLEGRKD